MPNIKKRRGITKLEIIIVFALVALIAAGIAVYTITTLNSINDDIDRSTLKTYQLSLDLFFFYNSRYPNNDEVVSAIKKHSGYMDSEILPCPRKSDCHFMYDYMEARLYIAQEGRQGFIVCGK